MASDDPCGPGRAENDLPGRHICPPGDGAVDFSYHWRHPGKPLPGSPEASPDRHPELTEGFNFGMILLPYTRDWGLRVGPMRRKKAWPTILHSFARRADRAFALIHAEDFIPKTDSYRPPLIEHLITAKPFAGFTWDGKILERWCRLAQQRASELGAPKSLSLDAAIEAAVTWCTGDARSYFELLSIERFPYSATDLIDYWHERARPDLPGAVPLPPGMEPPP